MATRRNHEAADEQPKADEQKSDEQPKQADEDKKRADDNPEQVAEENNEEVQEQVDEVVEKGFRGIEIDTTPNENYTVAGVTSGAPVPEAAKDPAVARREASADITATDAVV